MGSLVEEIPMAMLLLTLPPIEGNVNLQQFAEG